MKKKFLLLVLLGAGIFTLNSCRSNIIREATVNTVSTFTINGNKTMNPGDSQYLTVSLEGTDGGVITYSSSDEKVATVDSSSGLVTAVSKGKATITAKLGLKEQSFDITVNDPTTLKFLVTFQNDDGTVLYQEEVPYNEKAEFVGQTPAKSADYHYAYDFKGWDKDLNSPIVSDTVITAQYEQRDISNYLFTAVTTGEGGYMFYSFIGDEADVINIPSLYNNKPVTVLDSAAFSGKKVRKIILPDSLGVLKSGAFNKVSGLEEVSVPDSIYDFGTGVFSGVSTLKKVSLPSGLTNIPASTFSGCSALESIELPSGITRIDDEAFSDCTSLKSITIPSNVTAIGKSAFSGCSSLENVIIPETVTSIGLEAFRGCTSFTKIALPDNIETLGDGIFKEDTKLASVTWPKKLTAVPKSTFDGCTSLTSFDFSLITDKIGDYAFRKTGLKEVILADGITSLGWSVFADSTSLTKAVIPSSVTSLSTSTFNGCTSLTDLTNNSTVTMGPNNFVGNTGLTVIDSKIINKEMTSTAFYAFQRNKNLKTVVVPGTLKSIGGSAFTECPNLSSLILEEGVESIGASAFAKDTALSGDGAVIKLPKSLKTIGNNAFSADGKVLMVLKNVSYGGTKAELNALNPTAVFGAGSSIVCADGTVTI